MRPHYLLPALMLGFAAHQTQAAPIIYDQPATLDGNVFSSQNDTASGGFGNFATVYDNFTLAGSYDVTDVHWTGGYFSGSPSTITGFTLGFWSDNAGQPGVILSSYSIAGNANEKYLGDFGGAPYYSYDADLSTAFQPVAGVQYWLSVVPNLGFPPQWGWGTGTSGDGNAYQDFFGSRSQNAFDQAFQLTGVPVSVPVPTPFWLIVAALPGFRRIGKRRVANWLLREK